jgi:hypothetical protein
MPDTIEAKISRRAPAKPSFAAFVSDDSIAAVKKAAEEIGATQPRVVRGTVADATRRLADVPTPKQLIVDISGSIRSPIWHPSPRSATTISSSRFRPKR